MFTGIIEEIGAVAGFKSSSSGFHLKIKAKKVLEGLKIGDSVSVSGVCLTVSALADDRFGVDVVRETLTRSTLGRIKQGDGVNLERALPAEGRLDGHIVNGHVDGTGRIRRFIRKVNAAEMEITLPVQLGKYVVQKGSIAVDGISLTIAEVLNKNDIRIAIVPLTLSSTTLLDRKVGDHVNIEVDQVAKYAEKQGILPEKKSSRIDEGFLRETGFTN